MRPTRASARTSPFTPHVAIGVDSGTIIPGRFNGRVAKGFGWYVERLLRRRFNALRVLAGTEGAREALIAKYAWSNWRRDFGVLAADVLGAAADRIDDDPAAQTLRRIWLASRADTIYAGANEIQLNLIAERGLGMPR